MKIFILKLLATMMMALVCIGFTSCGGDDDDNSSQPEKQYPEGLLAVDLGLSVKWASFNVGATKAEEIGGYYAWGETEEKNYYNNSNYQHCDSESSYHDIGTNISGTQYDVATVKWGGDWRMPTSSEYRELVSECTLKYTSMNGINGLLVTGKNGNTIFFPAGGRKYGGSVASDLEFGCYWAANIEKGDGTKATARMFIFLPSGGTDTYDGKNRSSGMLVRPVIKSK